MIGASCSYCTDLLQHADQTFCIKSIANIRAVLQVYINPQKLLPLDRFLNPTSSRGGGGGGRGRGVKMCNSSYLRMFLSTDFVSCVPFFVLIERISGAPRGGGGRGGGFRGGGRGAPRGGGFRGGGATRPRKWHDIPFFLYAARSSAASLGKIRGPSAGAVLVNRACPNLCKPM
jgi:hypothetical protein